MSSLSCSLIIILENTGTSSSGNGTNSVFLARFFSSSTKNIFK